MSEAPGTGMANSSQELLMSRRTENLWFRATGPLLTASWGGALAVVSCVAEVIKEPKAASCALGMQKGGGGEVGT